MDAPKAKEFGVIDRVSLCAVKLLCGAILIRTLVFDINSTALNSKAPEKFVFHLVTNAIKSWVAMNVDNLGVTVEVQKFEDFKWLNASYVPVLKQLQDSDMQSYYFSGHNDDRRSTIDGHRSSSETPNISQCSIISMINYTFLQGLIKETVKE